MNQERQKTDAIADAVEIPDGATHYTETPMENIFLRKYKGMWQCYAFGQWFQYERLIGEEIKQI